MLSNLASYLLGFASTAGPEEQENLRVTAVEAEDDDWLVVDAVPRSGTRSRSSSLDSGVEESWFVTPPPCFTSTGPVTVETSPLENLLIEHPSMSVYRRVRRSPSPLQEQQQPIPAAPSPPQDQPAPPAIRPPLRPAHINTPDALSPAQACLLRKAQKAQVIKENQMLKTKNLERGNKTREFNKRNKKPRRADRQKNHSGANNNRKCY